MKIEFAEGRYLNIRIDKEDSPFLKVYDRENLIAKYPLDFQTNYPINLGQTIIAYLPIL
jgi:hypothetical protein